MIDSDDEREDPGPHVHVYVGTDLGDECEVCGRMREPGPHRTPSLYYSFTQNDGRGHGIMRLDAVGDYRAVIVDANLSESEVASRLAAYRREEHA